MNLRLLRRAPLLIVVTLGLVLTGLEWGIDRGLLPLLQKIEFISYDWRVARALASVSDRTEAAVGIVYINDATVAELKRRSNFDWPMARWIHAVVLDELTTQGAKAVGYDLFFTRERPADRAPGPQAAGTGSSDQAFAEAIARNGRVVLAAPQDPLAPKRVIMPAPLFAAGAKGVGHARKDVDADGVLRRVKPMITDPEHGRIWQLGLATAARTLGWDLERAKVDPWKMVVPDAHGTLQTIPLDGRGNLMVRWALREAGEDTMQVQSFHGLLRDAVLRPRRGNDALEPWRDHVVLVGSFGGGQALEDSGPSPLNKRTFYCAAHANVANSVLTHQFIRVLPLPVRLAITLLLVAGVGVVSWKLRAVWAPACVIAIAIGYLALSLWLLQAHGWWVPVALPMLGAIWVTYSMMTIFRVIIERTQKRRLRSAFEHIVSPNLLQLILDQPQTSWEPQEKVMTVFFADIRGFTALTDHREEGQGSAAERQGANPLGEQAAERDRQALDAVNVYLGVVVDTIKAHGATLDKYMGDCVMAFWGAPLDNPRHAVAAIQAAIDVQRRLHALNAQRQAVNRQIEAENARDPAASPLPLLPILSLGTGINTGVMTVGFMGSEAHLSNYTVFGREVNIASRLESLSGNSRVLVSKGTLGAAVSFEPGIAALARPLGPQVLKGIGEAVEVFEIEWQNSGVEKRS